jgi:oxygen-independent coproporphyrinogen III oxidase
MATLTTPAHYADAESIAAYLEKYMERQPGTKIQYGHPSPRFWEHREAQFPELLSALTPGRALTLYLHIPFCPPTDPPACGFCLFAREDFTAYGLVVKYVDYLLRELDQYHERLGRRKLRAIYFGGGTPNILKPQEARRIFQKIHECFEVPASAEVTLEGTPALFTMDRLEAYAEVGVNRLSIGAQMLKPHLIKYSGRKQRPEQIKRAVEFCTEHKMSCNVDLITGWFEQTPQDLVDDIDCLADWGVTDMVNHPLTLQGGSAFAEHQDKLPPVDVTCRSFLVARERLLERGYRADSYTDYRRSDLPVVQYLELYRDILNNDRIGVGYGANTLMAGTLDKPGHTYKNAAGFVEYYEGVDKGTCVDGIFKFNAEDLRLLYVLKGLEGAPYLRASAYKETFGSDLHDDFAPWWEALQKRNWLVWGNAGESPKLVGEGVFYMSTIQRSISEPRNAVLRGGEARLGVPLPIAPAQTAVA